MMSDFTSEHEHDNNFKKFWWQLKTFQLYLNGRFNGCNIKKLLVLMFIIIFITLTEITSDGVPTDHLDSNQFWFDRLEVLYSRWSEAPGVFSHNSPPYYSEQQKLKLGNWENFEGQSCPTVKDTFLIWVLKTPKSASSTLQDLIIALQHDHPDRFVVNTRQIRINHATNRTLVIERYKEYFKSLRRRTVFSAHGWFLNLDQKPHSKHLSPLASTLYRPVCIGTLRDPLKRLISHYEYLHEGPRSISSIERHRGQENDIPDFPTCVSRFMESEEDTWNCMHWANIQLKYFCGYDKYDICGAAGKGALEIAMENIHRYFLVVGLVERFEDMLVLLEREIPLFKGISSLYAERGSSRVNTKASSNHLRRKLALNKDYQHKFISERAIHNRRTLSSLVQSQNDSHASRLPQRVSDFLIDKLYYEQKLYDYAELRFDRQMKACS